MSAPVTSTADHTRDIVDRYGDLILHIAWRILPDADEVKDIYQETFLQYHAVVGRGETIQYPKAWLCRTATNAAFKRQRQRRRQTLFADDTDLENRPDSQSAKELEQNLLLDQVRQLAAELPDRQRQVFVLRNFQGMSFAEIAAQLDCTQQTARASEYKALKKIRAWMNDSWKETEA